MSRAVDEFGRASHRLPQVWPFVRRKVNLQILYFETPIWSVAHCPILFNQRFFSGFLGRSKILYIVFNIYIINLIRMLNKTQ